MKLLLTSAGVKGRSILGALVELVGTPTSPLPMHVTARRAGRTLPSALLVALLAFGAVGCGSTDTPPLGPVPDGEMSLTANNQSDRALELFVNGGKVADVPATSQLTMPAKDLQPLPWAAELRLPTGRTLLSLAVTSGSVVRLESGSGSVGTRVDLSCGRIELWAVFPLDGPPPGTGRPGDCGP